MAAGGAIRLLALLDAAQLEESSADAQSQGETEAIASEPAEAEGRYHIYSMIDIVLIFHRDPFEKASERPLKFFFVFVYSQQKG